MKKLGRIIFWVIPIMALISCSSQVSQNAYEKLLISLESMGYTVEAEDVEESIYQGERKWLTVNDGDNISVYLYESNEKMEKDASYISMDGFSYDSGERSAKIDWISYPYFYKSDNIIVLYVGDNLEMINALEEIVGPQFAGETHNEEEQLLETQPHVITVGYDTEDEESIFGDISTEEIQLITDRIFKKVSQVENNQNNFDSIIEEVFKQSGINDPDRLITAKSKLIISKNKTFAISYDINKQKEIFGDLSNEEISDILAGIADEVYEDEDYNNNFDSIIEKVFKNFGIDEVSKLNYAKTYIKTNK